MPDPSHRISQADLTELRARIPLVELIGRRVKLSRSGRHMKGCCPFHIEKTPSFYVYDDGYHCFGCGAHGDAIDFVMAAQGICFQEAFRLLHSEAGIDFRPAQAENANASCRRSPAAAAPANEHFDLSLKLAQESVCLAGTIGEEYLRFRGCQPPRGDALRFHPACPRGRGERLPAMLAVMTDPVSNRFVGVHRTFLRPDGMGKIEHGTAKMMLGNAGVIRLAPDDEITFGLGICEGIETGLALMQRAGWLAVWAAGSAGAILKFPILVGIDCLTIFPDTDDSGAGRKAAEACTNRWVEAGREVQTIWPPGGLDWNDALTRAAA